MKIKSITKVKETSPRYDIKVEDYSCFFANGILVHNTDAVNLMFSVKNRRIVASRNKGNLKNFGEKAMSAQELSAKFAGREVGVAYDRAVADLQAAIDKLSDAQLNKIFGEGRKWMSIEVIGHGGKNIIDYGGLEELRLHGTLEIDQNGDFISQVNKQDARAFDGMLRQREAAKQQHFTIRKLTPAQFKPIEGVEKHKKNLVSKLKNTMGSYKNIEEYKKGKLASVINKHTRDSQLINTLLDRWLNDNKSIKITDLYKQYPDDKAWIQKMDKNIGPTMKDIMLPLEYIFLELGGIVVGALNVFMAVNPENTKKDLKKQLDDAVALINAKGDESMRAKLALELKRIEAAGGLSAVSPEEGITFFVGDKFTKLTGVFSPLNSIINLIWRIPGYSGK